MRCRYLLLPLMLTGCAAPAPNNGRITIDSVAGGQPLPGADCIVSTYRGNWNVVTPASIPAAGLNGELRIICDRPGYRRSEVIYRPAPGTGAGLSQLGIGIGGGSGNVGVGLGMGVPLGGAGSVYPPYIAVEMTPQ